MKIKEALRPSKKLSRDDLVWILSAFLKKSKAEILLSGNEVLPNHLKKKFLSACKRREKGEPLQYCVGEANFFGRDFHVNEKVLIPRPETERLVEIALEYVKKNGSKSVVDVGTGSGVIGLTMKLERPALSVLCTDISTAALNVAKKNAKSLAASVSFKRADKLTGVLTKFKLDLVVSNPPYVSKERDFVSKEVGGWEPPLALYPSKTDKVKQFKISGTHMAHKILAQCSLGNVGAVILELSPSVAYMLERHWKNEKRVAKIYRESDFNQRKRYLIVEWKNG